VNRSKGLAGPPRPFVGVTRRGFLVGGGAALGGAVLAGCRRNVPDTPPTTLRADVGPDAGSSAVADTGAAGAAEAARPALEDPRAGASVRLDLVESLHLADVDHHGTFVDFGTPGRLKYTLGRWRSGWGADEIEDGVAFTWAGASPSRLYFHLDETGPLRLRFRARSQGRSDPSASLYLNDRPLTRVALQTDWSDHVVDVPADQTRAGENSLNFIHACRSDDGRPFAVDHLRIVPTGLDTDAAVELPRPAALVRASPDGGGRDVPVLALRAPTRASWYLEVPTGAWLGLGLSLLEGAGATATVRLTPAASGEAVELHRAELTADRGWAMERLDLSAAAGQVARIDLEVLAAEGAEPGSTPPVVGFAAPAVLSPPATIAAAPDEPARNVIVLLVDTLRADKLTVYGRTRVRSPEMERFAAEATLFERCQSPANWTKPACASVLTGLHPPSHRALTESGSLSSRVTLVSELFRGAGFRTAALIANGYLATDFGFNRGWDHYRNYIREERPTEAEHVLPDALAWLEQNRQERMFLYVQTIDPHVPYDPPEEDLRLYDPAPYSGRIRPRSTGLLLDELKRSGVELTDRDKERLEALYDGEVTYHDRWFGRFLDQLGELGLADSTCLVVTADHGEEFFEHGSAGHGHSLYQELLHVPLLVRCPGLSQAGQRLSQVCSLVDVTPTVLEAAGLVVPEPVEGRSLVGDLRGAPAPVLSAAFSSQWDTGNDWELGWTARVGDWKLRMRGPAVSYLHDLASDPREERDVDSRHPVALRAARIALGQFLGARSRRDWTAAATVQPRPRGTAPRPENEDAAMTPELCQQLHALGYMDACR
jgi:arylsulfatase A-like enzyme